MLSILQQIDHDTLSAATVAEAQSIINESEQKLDLLFTDIELGSHKEGGLTLGKLVEEKWLGMPFILADAPPPMELVSLFIEPSAFLPKPYGRSGFG